MELTKHENIGTVASSTLYSAFPFTLCRGVFIPLKICLIPLNLKRVVYCFTMGVQKKRTEQIYPQFQNAVGILILTAVLSLNFQASQNKEKKNNNKKRLYIQAHKIPLQSDVPVHKMSALVPSRVPRYQTESVPVETFKNCWMF